MNQIKTVPTFYRMPYFVSCETKTLCNVSHDNIASRIDCLGRPVYFPRKHPLYEHFEKDNSWVVTHTSVQNPIVVMHGEEAVADIWNNGENCLWRAQDPMVSEDIVLVDEGVDCEKDIRRYQGDWFADNPDRYEVVTLSQVGAAIRYLLQAKGLKDDAAHIAQWGRIFGSALYNKVGY